MAPPRKRQKTSKNPVSGLATPESEEDLEQTRRRNEQKLQGRFAAIYAKFGRDFTGISDEIDNRTGAIVVDNGHLRNMRHERDIGDHHRRAQPSAQEANGEEVDDELACNEDYGEGEDGSSGSEHDSERDGPFDSIWSDPNILNKTQTSASGTLASEVVQAAVPSLQNCDFSDPSFATTFSINLMQQVTQVMQTFQAQQMRQITAGPVVQNEKKQSSKRTFSMRSSFSTHRRAPMARDDRAQLQAISSDTFDSAEVDMGSTIDEQVTSKSIATEPAPIAYGRGRKNGYTSEEDEIIMSLSAQKPIDWEQLRSRLPHRTAGALNVRISHLRRISSSADPKNPASCDDVSVDAILSDSTNESASVRQPEKVELFSGSASSPLDTSPTPGQSHTTSSDNPANLLGHETTRRRKKPWCVEEDERVLHLRQQRLSWKRVAGMMPGRTMGACFLRYSRLGGPRLSTQDSSDEESSDDLILGNEPEDGREPANNDPTSSSHDEHVDEQEITTPRDQLCSEMQLMVLPKPPTPLYDNDVELIDERTRYQRRSRNHNERSVALDAPANSANAAIDFTDRMPVAQQDADHAPKSYGKKSGAIRQHFTYAEDKMLLALGHKCLPHSAYNDIASITGRTTKVLRVRHLLVQKRAQKLDHYDGSSKKDIRNAKTDHGNSAIGKLVRQVGYVDVIPPGYVIEILDSEDEGEVITGNGVEHFSADKNTTHVAVVLETPAVGASYSDEHKDRDNCVSNEELSAPSPAISAPVTHLTPSTRDNPFQDDEDELGHDRVGLMSPYTMSSPSTALVRIEAGSSPLANVNERTAKLKGRHKDTHGSLYRHTGERLLTPVSSSPHGQARFAVAFSPSASASGKLRSGRRAAPRMIMPAMLVDDDGSEDELA